MTLRDLLHKLQDMTPEQLGCNVVAEVSIDGYLVYKPVTLDVYRGSTYGGMIPEKYPLFKLD